MKCINKECKYYDGMSVGSCRMICREALEYCKHYTPEPEKVDLNAMLDKVFNLPEGEHLVKAGPLKALLKALIDRKEG